MEPDQPEAPGSRVLTLDVSGAVTLFAGILVAALLLGVFRTATDMLTKVGIGVIVALALDPLVAGLRRRGWGRGPAAGVIIALVATVFVALVAVMGPAAVRQASRFADELPETARQFYDLPLIGDRLRDEQVADRVEEWAADLPAEISDDTVQSITDSILGGLASTVTVLLVAVCVLIDGESLVGRVRRLIPRDRRAGADEVGRVFYAVVAQYFAGSLLVAGIAGLFALALGLLLGIPLTPLAAVWMAVTNLIPQVGGFLGGSVLVTLALSDSLTTGLITLACYLVYQNLENHVIQPAIVGERVDLSPPTTMLAALVGGAAAGVPGALFATPLVGAGKALWLRWRARGTTDLHPA